MQNYVDIAEKFIRENDLIFQGQTYEILSVTIHPSDDFFYRRGIHLGHLEWYFHQDIHNRQSMQYIDLQFHEGKDSYRVRLNSIRHKKSGYVKTGAGKVYRHILKGQEKFIAIYNEKKMSKENTPKLYIAKSNVIYKDTVYLLPRLMGGPTKLCDDVVEIYWRLMPFMAIKTFDEINKHKNYPQLVLISLHFYAHYHKKLGFEFPKELSDLKKFDSYRQIAKNAPERYARLEDAFINYKNSRRRKHKSFLAEAFGISLKMSN